MLITVRREASVVRATHRSPCFQAPNSLKARNTETGKKEADVVYSLV